MPLSVMDATPGSPLKVFSFGPSGTVGDNVTDVRVLFPSKPGTRGVDDTSSSEHEPIHARNPICLYPKNTATVLPQRRSGGGKRWRR